MHLNASMPDASISTGASVSGRKRRRSVGRLLLATIGVLWLGTAYWQTHKPLPQGVRLESPIYPVPAADVRFITDITTADGDGRPVMSHAIFDETLAIIRSAREFLVIDFFLFNGQRGALAGPVLPLRPLSDELRDALIERKQEVPTLRILFITDPINHVYGAVPSGHVEALKDAGIEVAVTDLDPLRDSNFIYSSFWRLAVSWWSGDGAGKGWLPNPFESNGSLVTARALAQLINFKANHRKVIIGDDGLGGVVGLLSSANPHDASSAHSNVALKVSGPVLQPLLESEIDVARFSGWNGALPAPRVATPDTGTAGEPASPGDVLVQMLTEGAIRDAILERIGGSVRGHNIDIAMFYIADRGIIEALLEASRRGVAVRLILDPNKDAFGRTKSGIPNRPAANELVVASGGAIKVRWYRTHGEQFHTKLVAVHDDERLWMTLGSANLTRRNIGDYNLEANVAMEVGRGTNLAAQLLNYFDTLWESRAPHGMEYTADFSAYSDPSWSRYWQYRIMEGTGLSTF